MTRDELEAAIRRGLTDVVIALVRNECDTTCLNQLTDSILVAADAYATYCGGITAGRRAELEQALRKPRNRKETPCPKQASTPPQSGGPSPSTTRQAATRRGS